MANITGQVTVDQLSILEIDSDPTTGGGLVAPLGSIAIFNNGTVASAYVKNAVSNTTGWDKVATLAFTAQYVSGATNLTTVGAIPYVSASGVLSQDTNFNWSATNKELTIGPAGTLLSNNYFSMNGNTNGFVQANVQNLSNGNVASGDLVVTADNGSDTANYVNLGTNSSRNADPTFTMATALDSYLSANGGKLVIGTENAFDVRFYTGGTLTANQRMTISSAGYVIVGNSLPIDITGAGAIPLFQIVGTSAVQMATIAYSNDTIPSVVNLLKSRGATAGTQGLVSGGDEIGRIQFRGSDGVNFQAAGALRVQAELTPAAGSMPGRLNLWTTPSGSVTPVERMRIDSTGLSTFFGITYASAGLRVGSMTDTTNGNIRANSATGDIEYYNNAWRELSFPTHEYDDFTWITAGSGNNQYDVINTVANGGAGITTASIAQMAGVFQLQTGATLNNNGRSTLYFNNKVAKYTLNASTPVTFEWRVQIPTLAVSGGADYALRIGLMDGTADGAGDPTAGIYFIYNRGSSTLWQAVTRNASTSTTVASALTVTAGTIYRVRAECTPTSVTFYINDGTGYVSIGSSTTNIPTAALNPFARVEKVTTINATSTLINLDSFFINVER